MALAIIGGPPARFVPFVDLYRESALKAGHDPAKLAVSINSHGFIAQTSQRAADESFPAHAEVMTRIGRERGWPPLTRERFDADRGPRGSLFVGSAQEVIDKIMYEYELFHHQRFLMQMSVGTIPHDKLLRSIEIFGTEVAPVVRRATIASATTATSVR